MATKLYGWACDTPHAQTPKPQMWTATQWTRYAPPQPGAMIYRAPTCSVCRRPLTPTGETFIRRSWKDLI